jgi:CheY-like chemotaxis protein
MSIAKLTPIMYIDDDKDDQEIFKTALAAIKIHHPVISFWNGEEAWEYLISQSIQPFIIFCDVNMPVMNGFELRRRISENKKLERACIPFIFYSTSAEKKYVDIAYTLTVQGYFKKPAQLSEIEEQLKRIIDYWMDCMHPNNC